MSFSDGATAGQGVGIPRYTMDIGTLAAGSEPWAVARAPPAFDAQPLRRGFSLRAAQPHCRMVWNFA